MKKTRISAQPIVVAERYRPLRWSIGLAGIASLLGLATAFAISTSESDATIASTRVTEQLAVQNKQALTLGEQAFFREERVQRGDTLGNLLARLGIIDSAALAFLRNAPTAKDIAQQLAPGKIVSGQTNAKGELLHLHFPLNTGDVALVVERRGETFFARELADRLETHTLLKSAEIRTSLFAASDAANIPDSIAIQLAELFAGDIDFHRDLRKGDRFSVAYEMRYSQGLALRTGRILSAEFINAGKTHRAVWFEQDGKGGYFTPDGKALRKAFLRSPLEFSRVTSGFSMRFHPILQEWRAHRGVDYGAPQGTRIRATGDANVEFAGNQKGYGNVVILKHSGDYSTVYGHLQGFSKGLRKGFRVNQGDTIGFVGQTGWATGPHLHYEFRVKNQPVNPFSIKLPSAIALEQSQMQRFKANALTLLNRLEPLSLGAASNFE